jgi:hypothetical protein
MISYPISYLINVSDTIPDIWPDVIHDIWHRTDWFHPWIRKLLVLSQAVKKFLKPSWKHSLNARVINDLIKDVLKNPEFNADEVNLVGGNHGHLHTFGCIQWECELFNGRPKARCYPFDIQGHHFRNNNP